MKIGLIARSEDRGLGVMTWAFQRNMDPAKTLLIRPDASTGGGFEQYPERFPGATQLEWNAQHPLLPERDVRVWLDGLDVVYSAETFYDQRIVEWAREQGVRTVLHAMPELWNPDWPRPDAIWLPTSWRAEHIPDATVVPVPVEKAASGERPVDHGPLHVLHVAGHRAMADRNGTTTFLQALRKVRSDVVATLLCQDRRAPKVAGVSPRVKYRAMLGPRESIDPYLATNDVLVMPRRYGGLCLPVQEGLATGCVPVMPACAPNPESWPVLAVPVQDHENWIRTAAGEIPMASVDPAQVAAAIDTLAEDRSLLLEMRAEAYGWASAHSWEAMRPRYEAEFGAVL